MLSCKGFTVNDRSRVVVPVCVVIGDVVLVAVVGLFENGGVISVLNRKGFMVNNRSRVVVPDCVVIGDVLLVAVVGLVVVLVLDGS